MGVSRREFLRRGGAAAVAVAGSRMLVPMAPPARAQRVAPLGALPSAAQIRDDIERMVQFGPRLTGTPAHDAFIDWVEDGLERAGCAIYPRDEKPFTYWNATRWSLDVLDGTDAGPVPLASYFPRSGETPDAGITAKLVPAERVDQIAGNIVLVDAKVPPNLTESFFVSMADSYHWTGHPMDPSRDYKRAWLATAGPGQLLQRFQDMGAAGAVFVLDSSAAAAAGCYLPFNDTFYSCPALWVDRDTGARLATAALGAPSVRLTLTAEKRKTTSPSLVGVLPGESDEVMIVNTHTDGQNAFEENGAVALVHLARYFSGLPAGRRLKRSLIFSAVTGHMTQELPQTAGFVQDHPDLVAAAAAGMTIEHFGCAEWIDDGGGYHATGDPEAAAMWISESGVKQPLIDSLSAHDIPHIYALRPKPLYLGIGGALYDAGVPGMSFIAGPGHLVNIAPNGHIDKLDPALAERQLRWTASILKVFDGMSAADMMHGDVQLTRPALGKHKPFPKRRAACLPSDRLGARGIGDVRLGKTEAQLKAGRVPPRTTRRHVLRYCVDRRRGDVRAVLDRGRVRLVTAPADAPLSAFRHRRRVARRVYDVRGAGQRIAVVRRGRVRAVGVTQRAVRRNVRRLRVLLRRGGL